MEPDEFLAFARELAQNDALRCDASVRTVISRSYYAAHHSAFRRLNDIGVNPLAGGTNPENTRHERIIRALRERNEYLADLLDKLRTMRVKADYFLRERMEAGEQARSMKFAEVLLESLGQVN